MRMSLGLVLQFASCWSFYCINRRRKLSLRNSSALLQFYIHLIVELFIVGWHNFHLSSHCFWPAITFTIIELHLITKFLFRLSFDLVCILIISVCHVQSCICQIQSRICQMQSRVCQMQSFVWQIQSCVWHVQNFVWQIQSFVWHVQNFVCQIQNSFCQIFTDYYSICDFIFYFAILLLSELCDDWHEKELCLAFDSIKFPTLQKGFPEFKKNFLDGKYLLRKL